MYLSYNYRLGIPTDDCKRGSNFHTGYSRVRIPILFQYTRLGLINKPSWEDGWEMLSKQDIMKSGRRP